MKYNIKLTIKSIIRTEQMLGKPFNDIDYGNESEVLTLFYCSALSNNPERFTFDEFKQIASNDRQYRNIISEFEKESKIAAQFSDKSPDAGIPVSENKSKQYISDLAGVLIMSGVSAEYVLNEMELNDLSFLIKAYDAKRKEEMEQQRMWTFYYILPHVDPKKIKSPTDIHIFPWEKEERQKEAERIIQENKDEFLKFMSGGFNHLIKN